MNRIKKIIRNTETPHLPDAVIVDDETLLMMGLTKKELDDLLKKDFTEGADYIDLSKVNNRELKKLTKGVPNGVEYIEKNDITSLS